MKLDGIRVLDLSLFLPGPYLTQMMADNGADVIKIEPPGGEPLRNIGYRTADGVSVLFRNTHRNKKSLVLDLKAEADRDALLELAETADVFLESFRPGVVERLGVDPAAVRARNPRIVYASISAFGQTGPEVGSSAHDLAIQAYSGALSLNLGDDGEPAYPGVPAADAIGSMVALAGILMALLRRERTNRGDFLDISMMDGLMSWLPIGAGSVLAEDRPPEVKNEVLLGGLAAYGIYRTLDGKHVALSGFERKFVVNLLTALGRADLIGLASGLNGPSQAPVKEFLTEAFSRRTRAEWAEFLAEHDVCASPMHDLREAFHSRQAKAREMLVKDADGNLHIGLPIKFAEEPGQLVSDLPGIGEHTGEILAELGKDGADSGQRRSQGVT